MVNEIGMQDCSGKVRRVVGDYICPDCGTKVIGGDHTEAECSQIKRLKDVLSSGGHRIEAC